MLQDITPVILTFNEAANIRRTLQALSWAKRIVVMDSLSTDDTESICKEFTNIDFIQREFDEHAKQWNAAISQQITTTWTLALDADYVVSDGLIDELSNLAPDSKTQGFLVSFIYKIKGKPLIGSLYPPVISLYRTGAGHYTQDGHTQRLLICGQLKHLTHKIYHDDRKSWQRWRISQKKYAVQEAAKLTKLGFVSMPIQDKLRVAGVAPLVVIPYTLLVKKVILNGWPGIEYTWQRFIAECYLQAARFRNKFKT